MTKWSRSSPRYRCRRRARGQEQVLVGAEMFFSSRGHFDRPADGTFSTDERLSQDGWQSCASCHFKGLSDGVVWVFGPGPRKSIPLRDQSQAPDHRASAQLLGATRRAPGLRAQHPQRLRPRAADGGRSACSAAAAPTPEPVRHEARPPARRRRHQPAALRHQRPVPQAEHRAHPSHRHFARQHTAWPALDALDQWMQVRGPRAQRSAHRPGAPGRRLVGDDCRGP